jgi:FkbM family methyltransferase
MFLKNLIKKQIEKAGYQIIKPNLRRDHLLRRMKLFDNYRINFLIDVGASCGQYATIIRKSGFSGRIVSFEPRSSAFETLKSNSDLDDKWEAFNFGLGDFNDEAIINISGNSDSSSLLNMLPVHIKHRPESGFIGKERVIIKRLDSFFHTLYNEGDSVFLKIDAQGYEYKIIEGAKNALNNINGLQIEMSIEPLYEGEKLICEMICYLREIGYKLMSIEPGSVDYSTGQMFQVDGIFFKDNI